MNEQRVDGMDSRLSRTPKARDYFALKSNAKFLFFSYVTAYAKNTFREKKRQKYMNKKQQWMTESDKSYRNVITVIFTIGWQFDNCITAICES